MSLKATVQCLNDECINYEKAEGITIQSANGYYSMPTIHCCICGNPCPVHIFKDQKEPTNG